MSKRPGFMAFGGKKKVKKNVFGAAAPAKRPAPGMGFGGAADDDGDDDAPKRPPPPGELMAGGAASAAADDVDPLDAFMTEVSQEVKANKPSRVVPRGEEIEEDDIMEGYEHKEGAGPGGGGDNSDDEVYAAEKKADKKAAAAEAKGNSKDDEDAAVPTGVLPKIDHAQIEYMPFKRDFYKEHPQVTALSDEAVASYKKDLDISVTCEKEKNIPNRTSISRDSSDILRVLTGLTGGSVPRPVQTFEQTNFPGAVMKAIEKAGYEKPSAVQAQVRLSANF